MQNFFYPRFSWPVTGGVSAKCFLERNRALESEKLATCPVAEGDSRAVVRLPVQHLKARARSHHRSLF